MPIDYKKYPVDWGMIRFRILKRAENRCECIGECGLHSTTGRCIEINNTKAKYAKGKVVLTIAHLDHDESNKKIKDNRLKAMCQRCHLRYDVPEKKRRRFDKKAISRFF
ncbi:hypothetical protein LCGC14_3053880 [marine sediment metagenome]|uniref:HNH domain-containing protein n=1 Tax=marine sediment metagenome TaxID=412755 RepID=A0A0F8WLE0_9ZZZZ